MKMKDNQVHVKLIYRIAWSFHKTTGKDLDDLIGEASLAYCEALRTFDPTTSKLTTWTWTHMKSRLINYCKKDRSTLPFCKFKTDDVNRFENIEDPMGIIIKDTMTDLEQLTYTWSEDSKFIVSLIFKTPDKYEELTPYAARQRLNKILINHGWDIPRIQNTIREITLKLRKKIDRNKKWNELLKIGQL